MSIQDKEKAFNDLQKALEVLIDHFNYKGNPTTEGDLWQLRIVQSKIDWLEKLMTMD